MALGDGVALRGDVEASDEHDGGEGVVLTGGAGAVEKAAAHVHTSTNPEH